MMGTAAVMVPSPMASGHRFPGPTMKTNTVFTAIEPASMPQRRTGPVPFGA